MKFIQQFNPTMVTTINVAPRKEFDLNSLNRLERNQFILCGLYPLQTKNKCSLAFHYLKYIILVIFSSILCVSMTISLSLGVDNLGEVTAILYYLITQSAYLFKLINFTIQRYKLPYLEEHLRQNIAYKYYKIFGTKNLDSIIRICGITGNIFRACITVVLVFYILVPLIDPVNWWLPFAGWMPVDKTQYRGYIFTVQITCFIISAYTNASLDIYTVSFISIGIGQLRLLKTCLMNIDYTLKDNQVDETKRNVAKADGIDEDGFRVYPLIDDQEDEEQDNKISASHLEELLILHKHSITFVNMIEDLVSYGIFIQFLASMAVICLSGFQMLLVSILSAEFVLLFFYFTCMMCQVILYCWYGNEIMFESSGIGEACYMSNWYEGTPVQKKVVIIMMERSKRQIMLTAGKFFNLTLTTLVLIVKSSYSYFAVLRRMYND